METRESDGRARVLRSTDVFIGALRASPAVQRFAEAQRRFDTDPDVQALVATLQRRANTFRSAQQAGEVSAAQVREVREAQAQVQRHPVVREFVSAQEAVGGILQETNRVISETLGMDFGQIAGPAGGAC